MNLQLEPLTFTVPLALTAHGRAEQFRRAQSNPRKAKQVYLNTLAVYAVNFYLQSRGFETELDKGESWNQAMQTLMDVADLVVKNHGKLECRPILPNTEVVHIPAESWSERIGYVAVQLDESLREATLLGFITKPETETVSVRQLRALEYLPEQLNQFRQIKSSLEPVKLTQWLQNIFDLSWKSVDELLWQQPQPAFNFRGINQLETIQPETAGVSRFKYLDLDLHPHHEQIALLVGVIPTAESEMDIWVKVSPVDNHIYLPQNLQLMVLDETEEAVMQAQARSTRTIQLKFSGEPGERFTIKVVLDDMSLWEAFVI